MTKPGEHVWIMPDDAWHPWPFCKVCGIVQRRDGQNKPCKGPTRLRDMERTAGAPPEDTR